MRHHKAGRVVFAASLVFLSGCASLAYRMEPPASPDREGLCYIREVPPVIQTAYQCGPSALESVIRYWGKEADAQEIGRQLYRPGTRGVLNFTLAQYARGRGFWTELPETDVGGLRSWLRKGIPPIVMLHVGPSLLPAYHFVVLKGFNDREKIFYVNTGQPETRAIPYTRFQKRWQDADCWTLILCPPERVDWELDADQAAELGVLLERQGRPDLAERWYRSALARKPSSLEARFNLANVYLKLNRLKEAKTIYHELVKEQPSWSPVSNNLAWIYLVEGKPQEAIRIIETAFKNGAQRKFDILDTLGVAYCRLKQYPKAGQSFSEALTKVPAADPEAIRLIDRHREECRSPCAEG